jgi:hypothetical protein
VRAYDGGNHSAYSNSVGATTLAPPLPPASVVAAALSSTSIRVSWVDSSTIESGYRVERSLNGIDGWTIVGTTLANATSFTNSFLPSATTYYYRVSTLDGTLASAPSPVVSATTLPPPAAPTSLTGQAISSSGIKLSWQDNATSESGYRIERSLDGVTWTQVAYLAANTTTYTLYGHASKTSYHFRVRAVDGTIYSAYSNVAVVTTP